MHYPQDPREIKAWDNYVKGIKKGVDNAYQAAIAAGYSHGHSVKITSMDWWKERKAKLRRSEIYTKAEKVLEKVVDLRTSTEEGKEDPQLLRIQADIAKYITNTLGKQDGYSTKTEIAGDPLNPIVQIVKYTDTIEEDKTKEE